MEPLILPGLLDDPQFQIADLPALTDFHIAPLRDPAPSRHSNIPLPLEPLTENVNSKLAGKRNANNAEETDGKRHTPRITPNDVLSAREAKRPHMAISELVDSTEDTNGLSLQLPSFVSLAVVEKSPTQASTSLDFLQPPKRLRSENESDNSVHDVTRHLPRPAQKESRQVRPTPLLPAMLTGLHDPPASAGLLPSMEVDGPPRLERLTNTKINVKDILMDPEEQRETHHGRPPELMVNSPDPSASPPDALRAILQPQPMSDTSRTQTPVSQSTAALDKKDGKMRRPRKKWTKEETQGLLQGVKKHGVGKWKQILEDSSFSFTGRSTVDLKDRYRVCVKDEPGPPVSQPTSHAEPSSSGSTPRTSSPHTTQPQSPSNSDPRQSKARRKRRAWTTAEDDALLKGVAKHGFSWTLIHQDVELDLQHRRATDLRDRIRNRFPDSYKHAESAPLRAEVKKAEKMKAQHEDVEAARIDEDTSNPIVPRGRPGGRDKEVHEQVGLTLPSFTLDDHEMDWEDNRLPPLVD